VFVFVRHILSGIFLFQYSVKCVCPVLICTRSKSNWSRKEKLALNQSKRNEDENGEINQYLLYINLDMDSLLAANDQTLAAFYEANLPEERGMISDIERLLALGLYQEANVLITSFVPETNIQSNFKEFFKLYYLCRTAPSLSTSDSTSLFILANQCPFTDGPAVYKARALYTLIYGTVVEYYDEDCAPEGYSERKANPADSSQANPVNALLAEHETRNIVKKSKTEYKIYPNPTIDAIYIKSKKENEVIHVIISDLSGRRMLDQVLSVNAYQTDLKLDLLNGIYTVTLINSKNERITKKLVISK